MNFPENMKPGIITIIPKRLIGMRMKMSLSVNRTGELWHSFMQRRKEIQNTIGNDLYSMQVYDPLYFADFNPDTEFEKWAAIEVSDFNEIPSEMESCILPGGLYAVFLHKGGASTGPRTFQYIFGTWLPDSGFALDNRPHFEILGKKYKHDDPDSEEEIWIPVKSLSND